MVRENMEHILASGGYEPAASIADASLALAICGRMQVDLVLMDVCTAGRMDGIDATAEIKAAHPQIKVIVVTSMMELGYLERAKKAGADSFWYKDISPQALSEVIERTLAGEHLYPKEAPEIKIGRATSRDLTPSELRVLRLVCEGYEYDEMAQELGIAISTVKFHVSNILQKTGYANKTRLAIAVINKKLIIPTITEEN